ncbi:Hsp70 family protein [Actinokineospora bangkokensis]|uniref:Hsp70 protein n=1 Tax=Actinokineospora bangkokensis TaxID=1193682 RepID=A0A1Q9LHA9_9PSEU|nr:Hsp70 family protein [Actinokineospora bangkokensis]OLR91329.1 hypothetical protein BJP25_27065 [Actinokineospora bangkokensis]
MSGRSYVLGIDLGRSRGAAAVCRRGGPAEVVAVDGARWFPPALYVGADGGVVLGRAALRLGAAEPDRLARHALDRVGDDTAVVLGGELYPAETLVAALVAWVADEVAAAEGAEAERIAVTHPAGWGPHRKRLLHEALHQSGLPGVVLLPDLVAAAETRHDRDPVPPGSALLVALVGATTSEQAVLTRTGTAFELTAHTPHPGSPAGDDLDDLLAEHAMTATPSPDETIPDLRATPVDPATLPLAAVAAFRDACTAAKERLSSAAQVRVPLPGGGQVVVTRAQFHTLAHPVLAAVADQVKALLATVPPEQLAGAVLAGGTAAVPLLADLAGCPAEDDPATSPARGAALAVRPRHARADSHPRLNPAASHPRLHPAASSPGFAPTRPATPSNPGFAPVDPLSQPRMSPVAPPPRTDGLVLPARSVAAHLAADPLLAPRPVSVPRAAARPPLPPPPPSTPDPVIDSTLDSDPPPPRPPVELTPLVPPARRFALPRSRSKAEDDDR